MKTSSIGSGALLSIAVAGVFALAAVSFPSHVHADTANVETRQILSGTGTCSAPSVIDVQPHVYDGALDSFDFVIRDNSYVVVGGLVGSDAVPFNLSSRWGTGVAGDVRLHVDTPSTSIGSGLPIRMTLLSTKGPGAPVCVSVVSFIVSSGGTSAATTTTPAPVSTTLVSHTYAAPAVATMPHAQITKRPMNATSSFASATALANKATSAVTSAASSLTKVCTTRTGSRNLWTILLVLYAILAAYAAFVKPGILARSAEALAGIIVLPFILLVGFWYFTDVCRPGQWVQLLTPAIALVGLVIAFWESAELGQALRNE